MPIKDKLRIYLDSNVMISYAREELGRGFRQLGEHSERFFAVCCALKAVIVLSDMFFAEPKKASGLDKHSVIEALEELGCKVELLEGVFNKSELEVFRHAGLHHTDAVHAHYCKVSGASCLVTWNKKHFGCVSGLIKVLTPEEFNDSVS